MDFTDIPLQRTEIPYELGAAGLAEKDKNFSEKVEVEYCTELAKL